MTRTRRRPALRRRAAPDAADGRWTEIRPTRGAWPLLRPRELWQHRDVGLILAARNVQLRYKQTFLGVAWVLIQPLLAMGLFTVVLGDFAGVPSDGIPYAAFVLVGLAVWFPFNTAVTSAAESLVEDPDLVKKVWFPRILAPLAAVLASLIDLGGSRRRDFAGGGRRSPDQRAAGLQVDRAHLRGPHLMATAIETHGLAKRYLLGEGSATYATLRDALAGALHGRPPRAELWALRGVDLRVDVGEAFGVIGRNGSGKTTLLRVLARITEPTSGRARIRGRAGVLLEVGTGFHPELTGRENIFLGGAIMGMSRRDVRARYDAIAAFAEVESFLDTPVKRYSSGMRLRLAFAVAAHLEPEVLLIDEVLAVGDVEFQRRCVDRMEGLSAEGRTIMFVSHDLSAVTRLCSRAVWIDAGGWPTRGPRPRRWRPTTRRRPSAAAARRCPCGATSASPRSR